MVESRNFSIDNLYLENLMFNTEQLFQNYGEDQYIMLSEEELRAESK